MGLKDNRQRLLVIGNEKDIKTFNENDSEIKQLNNWYGGDGLYGIGYEIDTTPNLVDIKYNIIEESMGSLSFKFMQVYLEEVITRYPNLNFVWTTIYDREYINTYLIKHNVINKVFEDKTIKHDYKKNINAIAKLFEHPNLEKHLHVKMKSLLLTHEDNQLW
mgnify:CR=1 FL=1